VLRLFYAIEFLIALIATLHRLEPGRRAVPSRPDGVVLEAGILGTAIAFAAVKATAAAVAGTRAWNSRTLKWISIIWRWRWRAARSLTTTT
jgi:hypothetical protein